MKVDLTHVREVLNTELVIASDSETRYRLTYNPAFKEFSVRHGVMPILTDTSPQECIRIYNAKTEGRIDEKARGEDKVQALRAALKPFAEFELLPNQKTNQDADFYTNHTEAGPSTIKIGNFVYARYVYEETE